MWVEFVVGSLLCSERFFSGYSGFPLSLKTNISTEMPIRFWNARTFGTNSFELLSAPWVNLLHSQNYIYIEIGQKSKENYGSIGAKMTCCR